MSINGTGNIQGHIAGTGEAATTGVNVSDGEPHQIGITYKSTATRELRYYVDGVYISGDTSLASWHANPVKLLLAARLDVDPGVNSAVLQGIFDEFIGFNYVLTDDEMLLLASGPSAVGGEFGSPVQGLTRSMVEGLVR